MGSKLHFVKGAQEWDAMRGSLISESVRAKALTIANVEAGKLAADIGSGDGFFALGLAEKGLRVIAVEPSAEGAQSLRRRLAMIKGAVVCRGELISLPLGDDTLDFLFADMCLHHQEHPHQAVKEMARVLKPGGRIVITDLDSHSYRFVIEDHGDLWMGIKRDEVRKWMLEAGLTKVVAHGLGENLFVRSADGLQTANISVFAASGQK